MDQIGDRAVLILYAAEPRNYANDVEWPFRQENDFFYLTGLTSPALPSSSRPAPTRSARWSSSPAPFPRRKPGPAT
jgi:hypothetical protein